MTPIFPGVVASGISGHLTPPYSFPTNFYSIATATVDSGGTSTITFNSIPQNYTHLQIRAFGQTNRTANAQDALQISINGDTNTSNYTIHSIQGDGSSLGGYAQAAGGAYTRYQWNAILGTTTAGTVGSFVIDILDYTNLQKYKTIKTYGGVDANGSGSGVGVGSNLWFGGTVGNSNNTVNSITFTPIGSLFTQYTQFALYGVK